MTEAIMPEYEWVADNASLARCCKRWLKRQSLMIDTEFERTQTFYPRPGLIQVYDGEQITLIDPLQVTDMAPLREVLTDPAVLKVVHSGSEDVELFIHRLAITPQPLFDTQIAAAYAGVGQGMGFQRLVESLTGTVLSKEQTRSDWLQRPLSEAQCHYASEDVFWLLPVFEELYAKLQALGRLRWLLDDTSEQVAQIARGVAPQDYYAKVKMAWQLKPRELAILRDLCDWREGIARSQDLSRNMVMPDRVLFEVAKRKPFKFEQLMVIEGARAHLVKRHGKVVLAIVEAVRALPDEALPPALPKPLSKSAQQRLNTIRGRIDTVAEPLNVPVDMLARKRDLEVLARRPELLAQPDKWPVGLQGWRGELLSECLSSLRFNE
ncbi:ribonuclease D [Pokkaliibacter plantistimulans]|nr:ribonuclease D [Pokkaliibacter plantistimulans]